MAERNSTKKRRLKRMHELSPNTVGLNRESSSAEPPVGQPLAISVGNPYPGYVPDNWSGLRPTIASGQFWAHVLMPNITSDEVEDFYKAATLIAVREGHLLYLGVSFGEALAAESSYTIHRDAPSAITIPLPSLADIPEKQSPWLSCILLDSATGIVKGIRQCVPSGFTRTWLAALHEQKRTPFNEEHDGAWASELISRYPTTPSLATHPHAVVCIINGIVAPADSPAAKVLQPTSDNVRAHALPPTDNPFLLAVVSMYKIAHEYGINAPIDEKLVKRLHHATFATKGNVVVPVTLSDGRKAQDFIVHITDEGIAVEVLPTEAK